MCPICPPEKRYSVKFEWARQCFCSISLCTKPKLKRHVQFGMCHVTSLVTIITQRGVECFIRSICVPESVTSAAQKLEPNAIECETGVEQISGIHIDAQIKCTFAVDFTRYKNNIQTKMLHTAVGPSQFITGLSITYIFRMTSGIYSINFSVSNLYRIWPGRVN